MYTVYLAAFFIGIVLLVSPGLVKKKMWRELKTFCIFLLVGAIISFSQVWRIKIFNPTDLIEMIFNPLAQLLK